MRAWNIYGTVCCAANCRCTRATVTGHPGLLIPRKEVIQPQVLLRLPCYDLVPITRFTVGASFPCGLGRRLQVPPALMA